MNNLTTEQKQAIFSLYSQAPNPIMYPDDDGGWSCKPSTFRWSVVAGTHYSVNNTRLSLKPLSAILDEDAVEVAKIMLPDLQSNYIIERTAHTVVAGSTGGGYSVLLTTAGGFNIIVKNPYGQVWVAAWITALALQYLTQQGYALPLYHGPNHPDNGKTAIELGLAIDATIL